MRGRLRETGFGWLALALLLGLGSAPLARLILHATASPPPAEAAAPLWDLWDERSLGLLLRSAQIASVASAIAVLAGASIGLLLSRTRFRGRGALALMLFAGFCVSPYVLALGWLGGDLASPLSRIFVASPWAVAWVLGSAYTPLAALIVAFGARQLSAAPEEAGLLLLGARRTFLAVVLPGIAASVGVAALFIFDLCLADYAVASLLQVPTYPIEVFLYYSGVFQAERAARACLPLIALGGLVSCSLACLAPRTLIRHAPPTPAREWPWVASQRAVAVVVALAIALVTLLAPLLMLLARLPGWQSGRYALQSGLDAVAWSLLTSGTTVGCTLLLAIPASARLADCRRRWLIPLVALLLLPQSVPASAYGIAWVEMTSALGSGLASSLGRLELLSPALCLSIRLAGPTALFLAAARLTLPRDALKAARLQEGRALRRAITVTGPLLAPAVLGCSGILLALALNATGILVLTAPPGFELLPLRTDNLLHYGLPEEAIVLALGTALLATAPALALLLAGASLKRRGRRC